jgi:hypothetical protein
MLSEKLLIHPLFWTDQTCRWKKVTHFSLVHDRSHMPMSKWLLISPLFRTFWTCKWIKCCSFTFYLELNKYVSTNDSIQILWNKCSHTVEYLTWYDKNVSYLDIFSEVQTNGGYTSVTMCRFHNMFVTPCLGRIKHVCNLEHFCCNKHKWDYSCHIGKVEETYK